MTYRSDIDGLRGVAVLLVILYHAFPTLCPYGFLGVDIFFVISGYLITGILLRGDLSWLEFIKRRLRRIVPALAIVLFTVWLVAWFDFFPEEFVSLNKEILTGSAFVSNIFYYNSVGYFDKAALSKPLLHLWSLGVEEQFYLLWPLVVWAFKERIKLVCVLIIAMSALLSPFVSSAALFYLLPCRACELALGGLLASYQIPAIRQLSWKPLVFIGLISYPLYLWHWPLLSLYTILRGNEPEISRRVLCVALTFVLAAITYKAEQFFRRRRATIFYFSPLVIFAVLGFLGIKAHGFPNRIAAKGLKSGEVDHETFHRYMAEHFTLCSGEFLRNAPNYHSFVRCYQSRAGDPEITIIGDSHAEAMFPGMASALRKNVVYLIQGNVFNAKNFDLILNEVINASSIRSVVINAYWAHGVDAYEIRNTVLLLKMAGKTVFIATDVPDFSFNPARCRARRRFDPHRPVCEETGSWRAPDFSFSGATVLDTAKYFMQDGMKVMGDDSTLYYRDQDHLGINGSMYLARTGVFEKVQ